MFFQGTETYKGEILTGNRRVRFGTIHYQTMGAGKPVIMLHGLSGSGRWWRRNVGFLAEHFQLFLVDLIGFGNSRGQPFALAEAAHGVLEWMDQLEIERAGIMGHSMGG